MQPGTSTVLEPQHVRARQAKASHSISFVVRPRWESAAPVARLSLAA